MIVLDEQIRQSSVVTAIEAWYPGRIVSIGALRPQTVIKDDSVETLLRQANRPTFVTVNVKDFWRVTNASPQYCVVCIESPPIEIMQLPVLLRQCFHLPEFKTKAMRMGRVVLLRPSRIDYYRADGQVKTIAWVN